VNVTAEIGRFRPLVLRRLTTRLEGVVSSGATLIVTVSGDFRSRLVRRGWPNERILVCPNAIDPGQFDITRIRPAERPERLGKDAFVVGYVGSFLPYHRLDMLLAVARRLSGNCPTAGWLLVGDGVERPRIEALAADAGLRDRFWMPGRVAHESVPCYIAAMDAAVLPNSATFNSPMKLFEYMAMGKAVVAPRVPAIAEVLRHGETGLLFEPGSADSLRGELERVIASPDLRLALGRNARECVLRRHTWQKNAARVVEAVDQGLERRPLKTR